MLTLNMRMEEILRKIEEMKRQKEELITNLNKVNDDLDLETEKFNHMKCCKQGLDGICELVGIHEEIIRCHGNMLMGSYICKSHGNCNHLECPVEDDGKTYSPESEFQIHDEMKLRRN